ncbi:winged helix-turn-helix domain-containing protein [Burkholderia multivorans]|uniref:winged helix-turn-helix domain-containing protein n=1 Tax=Burkholderia multivorans TaxID=87883 RepID=UPI0020196887|nr:winged helix-turn-helix domain-containing protein [Burkholderia multivorans]MCO1366473.1 winged helix-turn-helix domain-containing protein [Burkholderia multivorans]MCO1376082.1 winged helix-turn-helix domain-containing protein [Burkholderia multivorans]UQP21096.1 winged helix-turn-helix domain-containing protein [Burkholderia multivorans]UQP89065.1 winged helix-turn-helix domain-containing protein [Burkholderia multivorans]
MEFMRARKVGVLLLEWDAAGMGGVGAEGWMSQVTAGVLPVFLVARSDIQHVMDSRICRGSQPVAWLSLQDVIDHAREQAEDFLVDALPATSLMLGRYELDPVSRCVSMVDDRRGGMTEVRLSAREYELVSILFANVGRVVPKRFLMQRLWGDVDRKYDASLSTYISKIRNRLVLNVENGLMLSAVYSHGYRLVRV